MARWWTIAGLVIFGLGMAVGPKPEWVTMLLAGVGIAIAVIAERRGGYWQGRADELEGWQ
jgi:hypothetical protein